MLNEYIDIFNSERSVEIEFVYEQILKRGHKGYYILDVGGMPTRPEFNRKMHDAIRNTNSNYDICDFTGGKYRGDFMKIPLSKNFDMVIFLSSIEHFPQCTEGDMFYREKEDMRAFQKASTLLKNKNGVIILTVPFGEPKWQQYHQNYNMNLINQLSVGMNIIEMYTYLFINNKWEQKPPHTVDHIIHTDRIYCVGCFVFGGNHEI